MSGASTAFTPAAAPAATSKQHSLQETQAALNLATLQGGVDDGVTQLTNALIVCQLHAKAPVFPTLLILDS